MPSFSHITYNERMKIEVMYNKLGYNAVRIADTLGHHNSTIYRELHRGMYERSDTYLRKHKAYSADVAQKDYNSKATAKGAPLKIGNDHDYAAYLEDKILNHKYSPGAAVAAADLEGQQFSVKISRTTLYRYIDCNLFLQISNKHLPHGKRSHRPYKKIRRISLLHPEFASIEQRPVEAAGRQTFGHWEMDTVVGRQKGRSTSLLVLTERMTRQEIIIKIQQRNARCVVRAVDKLQRSYGSVFPQIFKTITVDNGGEFSDVQGIERNGRTKVFHCHPYSSYERGSNENANKLIRRFIPKGTDISKYSQKEIDRIQHWINNYPRTILGHKTSDILFNEQLSKLAA